ncbi:MAG: CRTAC1 family protein [Chloroflexota bacterium]
MIQRISSLITVLILSISIVSAQDDITVDVTQHSESACSGVFVAHELDHITSTNADPIRMFDSNGSGLAINDLNNDGLLDIVLANLDGEETILWNEGDLSFRTQQIDIPVRTRQVMILDIDADGLRDLMFTSQRSAPTWWRNLGDGTFELTPLLGGNVAYAMNATDADQDGDLDFVAASYDIEMQRLDASYLLDGGAGVYYYENQDGDFVATRLADQSQALAVYFTDLNSDNQPEIAIGNDFAELDTYWELTDAGWESMMPFDVITHSTMSFASADVDNNGAVELYATDMHPYSEDEATVAAWQPIMDDMMAMPMIEDDPQVMVNVLQTIEGDSYQNMSDMMGINYTGWSWSAKFGDLNSDGYVDLYVVNGMIAEDLFGHLPNNELVEENQTFMNNGGTDFATMPDWGLNATASGRGMSMADLDNDGDLDVIVNNLMSPAMLYENQLCEGNNLTLSLRDLSANNVDAIGAQAILTTSAGVYQRQLTAASGYLSGDANQLHFGIPDEADLLQLEIMWSDGSTTFIESLQNNTHMVITRDG